MENKKNRLLVKINNPDEKNLKRTLSELEKRIISIFRSHIGKANSISASDLFTIAIGEDPLKMDVFQRSYLWNVIKGIIHKLKMYEILFIVNDGINFYVLQTMEEFKVYEQRLDRMIESIKESKRRAYNWVKYKKYNNEIVFQDIKRLK